MLTPSTRATIRPRTLSTSAIPSTQTRTLFGWKPRLASYDSHLDPLYPRFIRHRTLKTRAKLLKTIRRRQQFDWDADVKPIAGPKHVRHASHWDGTNRPKWAKCNESEEKQGKDDVNTDAYELSDKEKAWKKQMDSIRKRIEADPYEAVFGKRFEPFWSPLFPQWMKEEASLREKEPGTAAQPKDPNTKRETNAPETSSTWKPAKAVKPTGERQAAKQAEPYTYASSTSWDSHSNKTKKSEWDSVSRRITSYEYDPVSNRMVPTLPAQPVSSQQEQTNVPAHVTWKPIVAKARSKNEPTDINVDKVDAKVQKLEHVDPIIIEQKGNHPAGSDVSSSKPQHGELDTLTAVDLRASMGKQRSRPQEQMPEDWISEQRALKQQIRDWDNSVTKLKSQVSAIVDEASATHLGGYLPTSLERHAQKSKSTEQSQPLQPAVQRMQSKTQPESIDLDDAAAHESTEPIAKPASVPNDWYEQADILQSDRVMRTRGSYSPTMRWLDDMNARRAEYQKQKAAADADQSTSNAEKTLQLEKANAMLQAEVASQRLAMSEHQDRSAQKIRSLRGELETAYKQSSVHADAFRDRIAGLDKELTAAKSTANEVQVKAIKERYSNKVASLQKELERAYVQSSVHADEFTKRIKELEVELVRLTKAAADASNAKPAAKESKLKEMQGEGDFCPNVTKFADSEMWYKQPSSSPQSSVLESSKAEQKAREQALVSEVRSIYETAYGTIDAHHRQPRDHQNSTLESALAKHDRQAKYAFKDDGLESELTGKVISAAGDAIKQERLAYAYKKDDLEAELAQRIEVETQKKDDKEYAYRDDGFEPRSQDQKKPIAAGEPRERFAKDGLEAELVKQSKSVDEHEPSQKFIPDDLEAELKTEGEGASSSEQPSRFRADDLEAELKKQCKAPSSSEKTVRSFRPDGLEAELKRLANEQPEYASDEYAAEAAKSDKVGKMEITMADSLGAESQMPSETATSAPDTMPIVQWRKPPVYKKVTYEYDEFTTVRLDPWGITALETPITISQALDQLDEPSAWEQRFGSLMQDPPVLPKKWRNYQIVGAHDNEIVLRKVEKIGQTTEPIKSTVTPMKAAKPFEAQHTINPVDGTHSSKDVRPATGDYANPTGYVNLDLAEELASKSRSKDLATDKKSSENSAKDPHIVKRQEPVFSGSQRIRKAERRAKREAEEETHQEFKKRTLFNLAVWTFKVSLATSIVMYVIGTVAEMGQSSRKEKEPKTVEAEKGSEGRWKLDEGQWKKK